MGGIKGRRRGARCRWACDVMGARAKARIHMHTPARAGVWATVCECAVDALEEAAEGRE